MKLIQTKIIAKRKEWEGKSMGHKDGHIGARERERERERELKVCVCVGGGGGGAGGEN